MVQEIMQQAMQYIEQILYLSKDYWILSIVLSFFAAYIESFFPALPLLAIATVSAAVNGFVVGFIASWLGTCAGTASLYFIVKKFMNHRFFKKIRTEKLEEVMIKMKKTEFKALFVFYAIPVMPSFLVTIASAMCGVNYKEFITSMIFGKFFMMFLISYVGSDISGFIRSPIKIAIVIIIALASYLIANKMKKDIETHEEDAIYEYNRIKNTRRFEKETKKHIDVNNKNFLAKQYFFRDLIMLFKKYLKEFFNNTTWKNKK
ncbi:TVP38/TMEM64 family protein [Peptostreptococcus faecalis]|uniref:TVP38/TMEM64 family protein n=1 Tax=Peptostreptococcus faecalis TaxID=2045015 RepID=UPI001FA8CD80|nr:VTT domain-containing protein [Peptostreptococcus faecalis]